MAKGTSEVPNLSEKINQPLRNNQEGNQLKINSESWYDPEVNQMLMKQINEVEHMIRTYEGDDPLEVYYNYMTCLEQSFPRMELNNNFISLLENILTKFKDCQQYKQDIRFVQLLVKYITVQPNPVELYQLVYRQGLGTKCSLLYISWAEELERNNDFRKADHVYQIGINRRAQPLEELHNNHVQFQIKIARKMLEGNISVSITGSELTEQTVPTKLRSSIITSCNSERKSSAAFEPFCEVSNKNMHDIRSKTCEEKKNKSHILLLNENKEKETGRWVSMKQKHTSDCNIPSFKTPYEVTKSVEIRPLKIKKEELKCPVAVFEPPDPTKIPMYPKQLVYENGCDTQLEEIRAAFYWKKIKENESKEKYFQENCFSSMHEKPAIVPVPVLFNVTPRVSINTELSTQNVRNPVDSIKRICNYVDGICPTLLQKVKSVSGKTIVNPIDMIEVTTNEKTLNQEINLCSKMPETSESVRKQTLSDSDLSKALPNSEISTRERSWYLATEFIKPVKHNEKNGFSCMNSKNNDLELITSSKTAFPKCKSNCMVDDFNSGLNQNDEFQNIHENAKSTSFDNTEPHFTAENDCTKFVSRRSSKFEDEIVNFINHCNRDNISTFHHSPSASFTVNTRTAMNVIQKMWESPLAPRGNCIDSKMTKSDEDSDSVNLFRVPTILQSQCSKASVFADETESNSKLSTAHTNESNLLVKPEQKVSFPIFTDEVKKSQTICAGEEMHRHVINHNYIGTNVAVCCENHCKKPMIKVTSKDSFDVQKMKDSDFVKSRVPFSLFGEEKNNIMTSQLRAVSTVHETEVLSKSITDLKISIEEEAKSASSAPLIIPVKLQETPPTVDNKENMPPEDYLFKHCERKPLSEIKVTNKFGDDVSNNESFDEDTCSTKAFAISLPSSTPFARSNGYRKLQN